MICKVWPSNPSPDSFSGLLEAYLEATHSLWLAADQQMLQRYSALFLTTNVLHRLSRNSNGAPVFIELSKFSQTSLLVDSLHRDVDE